MDHQARYVDLAHLLSEVLAHHRTPQGQQSRDGHGEQACGPAHHGLRGFRDEEERDVVGNPTGVIPLPGGLPCDIDISVADIKKLILQLLESRDDPDGVGQTPHGPCMTL